MNSNFGNNFDFDLGIGSSRNVSLSDQKNNRTSSASSYSSSPQPKPAWQPNKPSWTHQPAPPTTTTSQSRPGGVPSSMVGDIFGKSWSSSNSGTGIGIVDKNPNLFGDLVNSALGQQGNSKNSNSLRNSAPAKSNTNPSSFSMGNVADSLPKNRNSSMNWGGGSSVNYSKPTSGGSSSAKGNGNNVGGAGVTGIGGGVGIGSSKPIDPFGSLVDFGSKPMNNNLKPGTKTSKASDFNDTGFGDFLNAPKPSPSFNLDDFAAKPVNRNTFQASNNNPNPSFGLDDFAKPATGNAFSGFNNATPSFNTDDFVKSGTQVHTSDPLDSLFTPSSDGFEGGQLEMDDWGTEAELGGGGGGGGTTTELDGLPPPPAGVNASAAKSKGMDNYRQGQYADAIKWLSWAVVLLEKSGEKGTVVEVLSSRASCYKEVGEYKKAVADCTKVLEQDNKNVSVLVQRALLYESMEKYRLGAEDLRTVLKIDPSNRVARSTVHRLSKLSD